MRAAFAFFTRLPVGRPATAFQDAAGWLPVVGLAVGCLAGAVTIAAASVFPPFVCGVLGCLAWTVVTGGLHLDGVADCGDGLWVEADTPRRLEIMRDSRLGTFGGAALFFVLALKTAALAALTDNLADGLINSITDSMAGGMTGGRGHAALAVLAACGCAGLLARAAVLVLMRRPSARPGGLGDALRAGVGGREERLAALLTTAAVVLAVLTCGPAGLAAPALVLCLTIALARGAERRLGGMTGDVFGCLVESAECAALLAFAARW